MLLSQDCLSTPRLSCAVWLVYEQVAIAALDSRAMALATSLIQKVRKKFPKSSRTHRLTVRHPISYHLPTLICMSYAARLWLMLILSMNFWSLQLSSLYFYCLQSMYLEACGETAKLSEFHKQILEDDENNEAILKRQVSMYTLSYT